MIVLVEGHSANDVYTGQHDVPGVIVVACHA